MSSKNTFKNSLQLKLAFNFVSALCLSTSVAFAQSDEALQIHQQPFIRVIYPKPGQTVSAIDSTFIHGHLGNLGDNWTATLTINDIPIKLYPENQFLAFVPVQPDSFVFHLKAYLTPKKLSPDNQPISITNDINVYIPPPIPRIPIDTMVISRDYNGPTGDIVLTSGDELVVSFAATPFHRAWFSIPGVVDSVPMSEILPQNQSYWGEAAFGAGSVSDSHWVSGIYSGYWKVTQTARIDTAAIVYNLAPPSAWEILSRLFNSSFDSLSVKLTKYLNLKILPKITAKSSYRVTLNSPDYPYAVRFKDSITVVRHGPQKGYQSIHQPKDIIALVIGGEKPWHKIKLSKNQFGWVHDTSVVKIGKGIKPPISYLKTIRTNSSGRKISFEFPLAGKHPFRIYEDDKKTLRVQLFGVITDTDWIRYDFTDTAVDLVTWSQPEEELYEVKINLTEKVWGYDAYYKGNTLFIDIIKPPEKVRSIKDKIIVIDPGHSPDPGSIGPTGYTEAEANLGIALALKQKLESRGAKVIMTRMDNASVTLYDRPVIAKLNNADIFVSVHNNALPDGVNPWKNNGTSTYYYHPHSIDLGKAVHKEMLIATGLSDHGFYHGNLAVNRPTQFPAVLVECAFMIIPEQEQMLKTDKFRKRIADAITVGIEKYLKDFDRE